MRAWPIASARTRAMRVHSFQRLCVCVRVCVGALQAEVKSAKATQASFNAQGIKRELKKSSSEAARAKQHAGSLQIEVDEANGRALVAVSQGATLPCCADSHA